MEAQTEELSVLKDTAHPGPFLPFQKCENLTRSYIYHVSQPCYSMLFVKLKTLIYTKE